MRAQMIGIKLMYLAARAKRASNFETGFLARNLKKSRPRDLARRRWPLLLAWRRVLPQRLVIPLSQCEEAELRFLKFPAVSKLVQEQGPEFLEAPYRSRTQLVKPLLSGPSESSHEDSTLDPIRTPMQRGCVLKMRRGSVDPSYSVIAGVRQFAGSSGHPIALLLEFLLSGGARLVGLFEETLNESATVGGLLRELLEGALMLHKVGKISPDVVSVEVLRLEGSTNDSVIPGGSIGTEKDGTDPPTSIREFLATTYKG
ncbi:UNVERIFIED_CONTAM: hypothetical protein Sindi_1983300 [Sesamum indicum]